MKLSGDHLHLSPTDLTTWVACPHATTLEMAVARGRMERPVETNPDARMLARKGEEHEAAYLAHLTAQGLGVTTIDLPAGGDFEEAARVTEAAMREGADVVYQGVLLDGRWRGLADFLMRVDRPSDLGAYSYEAVDTKLARHAKPSHILQLLFYSEVVAGIQGAPPQAIRVRLGSGEEAAYRPGEFTAYYRRLRRRFQAFVDAPPTTEPYPCDHCALCAFSPMCTARWEEADHLSRVAGLRRTHIAPLADAGITTMTGLADAPVNITVPGTPRCTLARLRAQAALQRRGAAEGPLYELLPPVADTGFALLPDPSPGDLFFDIEGHPFWSPDGGLEYLWGLLDTGGRFDPLWARDRATERDAFEGLVDRVHGALARHPDMHVYHYAAYEVSALRRLMGRHGTREDEVDEFLRRGVLVDLFAVVRNALRTSQPNLGLKALEVFLPIERRAEIKDGGTSIVEYERYVQTGDTAILDQIAAYNEEDCVATRLLRDWLLQRKDEAVAVFGAIPVPEPKEPAPANDESEERARLRRRLLDHDDPALHLAGELLEYHHREDKPVWWAFFDRMEQAPDELVEDAEAIGMVRPVGDAVKEKRSWVHEFVFPPQEYRLGAGDTVFDPATRESAGTIVDLDREARRVRVKRGPSLAEIPLPDALLPGGPYGTTLQKAAVARVAQSLLAGDGRYPAIEGVLRRTPFDRPVQTGDLEEQTALVRALDGQHLVIQGPPGSGKTFTGGRLIADLIAHGRTVGVASTSHRAIHNLLDEVEAAAATMGLRFDGRKKETAGNPESQYQSRNIQSHAGGEAILGGQLAAGTAWLFSRHDHHATLDYLVIDEAGQVSLADAVAMGTCARNLVFLGDPLQLAQVVQGHHPEGSGDSVLQHLLGEHATVPPERGLFLERTFRLHPDVCGYISEVFYEGRLRPAEVASTRTTPFGTGLRHLTVEHEGCRQSSVAEADAVAAEVERLRAAGVAAAEIVVVAPYNAQVELLRERLPDDVRAGTVDKFQGQEADVVLYSMASSSGEDVPRGLDFLLSRNRLNVAVSRARCLAYLVCSPRLLEIDCRSIEHMRLANALCRFVEMAESA